MITYRKMQIEGENHPCNGLWYARPVITETLDITALSKHMAKHNTPFSPGVIKGVLADMVACIKELILDGKNVKLDDLAIFSVGIVSDHGAESAEAFKVSEHVKGLEGQLKEALPYSVTEGAGTTTGGGSGQEDEDGNEGSFG